MQMPQLDTYIPSHQLFLCTMDVLDIPYFINGTAAS